MNQENETIEIDYVSPLVVEIKNTSDEKREWVLFGFNQFNQKPNFGNSEDIKITTLDGIDYSSYFNSTSKEDYIIGKSRYYSSEKKNIKAKVFYHENNIFNGTYTRKQLDLSILMDAYQQQGDIIDFTKIFNMSASHHLSGTVQPNSTLCITFYPRKENSKIPRTSGLNCAPVIIHSVSSIKTKNKKVKTKNKPKTK